MTEEQQKSTLEACECLHAITDALQKACMEVKKHNPPDQTPEAMLAFFFGLRNLVNAAHAEMLRATGDMAEALSRANPHPKSMN